MKILISILFIFLCINTNATNRYFSSSTGNDATGDGTIGAPYASLSKLNSLFSTFGGSDSILLKAGDTFYGFFSVGKNGTSSGSPIVISRYGTGADPVITSLITLTGFTSAGTNKYQVTNSSLLTGVKVLLIDGCPQAMGRYPNVDAVNKGYLSFESWSGTTTIIDNELTASPNWTGAQAVVRTAEWILDPRTILNHTGTQLTFSALTQTPTKVGNGYFIQNDIRTLDKNGEWYYKNQVLTLYLTTPASGHTIQASSKQYNVVNSGFDNITFSNLTFTGSQDYAINVLNSTNTKIKNCTFNFHGMGAVQASSCTNLLFQNNTINQAQRCGLDLDNCNSTSVLNNVIRNIARFEGMQGVSGVSSGEGIYIKGDDNLVKNNSIINVGRSSVNFRGNNFQMTQNYCDSFDMTTSDHGGIYTVINAGNTTTNTAIIDSNIVINGIGAPEGCGGTGTAKFSGTGIYIDVAGANIKMRGNTVKECYKGLYLHYANNMEVRNNKFYNNRSYQMDIQMRPSDPSRNFIIKNNVLFVQGSSQKLLNLSSDADDLAQVGVIDSNRYVYYETVADPFITATNLGSDPRPFGGAGSWRSLGFDTNGDTLKITSTSVFKNAIAIANDSVFLLTPYSWKDALRALYFNTVTKRAWTSEPLLRSLISGLVPPVVSISSSAVNTPSPGSITLSAIATDQDGSIVSVSFIQDGVTLGADVSNPYTRNVTGLAVGTYTFTARATDNDGLITTSSPITVTVTNTLPTVSITSPSNNATYTTGDPVNLTATASDANGTIARVNFYRNGVFLSTDASSPYTASWTSTVGGHAFEAWAVDNEGDSAKSTAINITVGTTNIPPSISFRNPTADTTIYGAATIHFIVSASDPDGIVSYVNWYDNGVLFSHEIPAPYERDRALTVGVHNMTAVAGDNTGDSTISAIRKVTVLDIPNIKPTVTILSPTVDSGYTDPADVDIEVSAADEDGTISAVNFYSNGVFVGSVTSSPYTLTLSALAAGGYSLEAHAIDNDGDSTISEAVNIVVAVPVPPDPDDLSVTATITSPILCNGGQATVLVSATGGSGTYVSGTGEFSKLAGVYDFIVEDDLGTKDTLTLAVNEPGALSATATLGTITQRGGNASVEITAIGGTTPYEYSKNGTTWQTSNIFVLKAGSYTITVRDANGCTGQVSFELKQPKRGGNYLISNTVYIPL